MLTVTKICTQIISKVLQNTSKKARKYVVFETKVDCSFFSHVMQNCIKTRTNGTKITQKVHEKTLTNIRFVISTKRS